MALENVIDELLSQAKATAESKIMNARNGAIAEIERAKNEAESIRRQYESKLKAEADRLHGEAKREAEIETRLNRQKMVKRVLDLAYAELFRFVSDRHFYAQYLQLFIDTASAEFGHGIIHMSPLDSGTAAVPETFRALYDLPESGGIIAESADRTVVLDLTVDTLLRDFWHANLPLVHSLLFG
jgi:vacuolar-type H+-ATPase subunit E/Vma4